MKGSYSRAVRRYGTFVGVSCALITGASLAVVPYYGDGTANPAPPADPDNYAAYLFIKNGDCSSGSATPDLQRAGFDCKNFKFTDYREPRALTPTYDPTVENNPQELF